MDFFKSVFSDDPEPPSSPPKSQDHPNPNPSMSAITNAWSFGGLIKTIASKSESVIDTYRRDLEEFGSGLRKETAAIGEVASRAVKDLPRSFESGAVKAQGSLESVGLTIDHLGNTVSQIISHGTDSILDSDSDPDSEASDAKQIGRNECYSRPNCRADTEIRAIQCDLNTYCEEPEDLGEYNEWRLGFDLDEKGGEIENLIEENGVIGEICDEVVPSRVDKETFWYRYFYRVYKLRKAEEAKTRVVKRAISGDEEEDLSWDVDDDDYEDSDRSTLKGVPKEQVQEIDSSEKSINDSGHGSKDKTLRSEDDEKGHGRLCLDGSESGESKLDSKIDDKLGSEGKAENGGSCKDSDFSVVSSQPSMPEEEELCWDEIEDIARADEVKVPASGSPTRADLRKRLSAMEEEEDLTWDIEDDDEPIKS
ncbi:uncharacterized protein LOC127810853 [Diospyros lotus]|uniref:uncharacterized protein LOC127810853 n=1 Tax=Diospyros lotus TaxID=55363 RepID=UPI00224D8865|nr:uncharacterized protein LOC127810853 [Diospyros lotus]